MGGGREEGGRGSVGGKLDSGEIEGTRGRKEREDREDKEGVEGPNCERQENIKGGE